MKSLAEALRRAVPPDRWAWVAESVAAVGADPRAVRARFPAAGRHVGRGPLGPEAPGGPLFTWTLDDAARALLLDALGPHAGEEVEGLYRHGDSAERRAVLRWLTTEEGACADRLGVGAAPGAEIVGDALRSSDPRLVAAALGPAAVRRLDGPTLHHAVLKCVFLGVPLAGLIGLGERADAELARMLAGYVHERVAAGRDVPEGLWPLIDRHPPADELAAITAELDHPVPERRRAAAAALASRAKRTP